MQLDIPAHKYSHAQTALRRTTRKWVQAIWERIQNIGKVILAMAITTTVLYVVLISLPKTIERMHAAPVFVDLPTTNVTLLVLHVITAVPPLIIGIILFSKRLRNASLRWHRWGGAVYCVCIWISASLGAILALANTNGPIAQAGFGMLGYAWFATTWFAYDTIRKGNISSHRMWMIRSYSLTLAVVTIRPMFIFGPLWGMSEYHYYLLLTWICWVPNLLLAELYIRITRNNGNLAIN